MAKHSDDNDVIFEARDLKINAVRDDGSELPIVKGVDFKVRRGEVVALIGESGSGKTTISLSALGYCKPGLKFAGGEARLLGQDVTKMSTEELRPVRGEPEYALRHPAEKWHRRYAEGHRPGTRRCI